MVPEVCRLWHHKRSRRLIFFLTSEEFIGRLETHISVKGVLHHMGPLKSVHPPPSRPVSASATQVSANRRAWIPATHSEHGRGEQTPGKELQEDDHHRVIDAGPADTLLELKDTQPNTGQWISLLEKLAGSQSTILPQHGCSWWRLSVPLGETMVSDCARCRCSMTPTRTHGSGTSGNTS